jgi:hypothetical protein
VAELSVANEIDAHVALESLTIFHREFRYPTNGIKVIRVHMERRNAQEADDVT